MSRYWLVKVPDGGMAETVMGLLETLEREKGVEVVHIVPEHRESNWMEREIAARLAAKLEADNAR